MPPHCYLTHEIDLREVIDDECTPVNENGTINESSFLCNLYSIISDETDRLYG